MIKNLEARTGDSASILITEHNSHKHGNRELFGDTFSSIRTAIESGKADEIPPIAVLKSPFDSIEKTIELYREYIKAIPRLGGMHYENEGEILRKILEQNQLLCYNGNRRLEQFQKAGRPIKAFVITFQEEYDQIPRKERIIRKGLEDRDQNYVLSYLRLLDDAVYITAQRRYWDNLDTRKLLAEMHERRTRK